MTRVCWLEGCN